MFVRPTRLPEDAEAIGRLDTSFTTSAIYEVEQTVDGFELTLRPVDPPVVKRFPLDDLSGPMRPWTHSWVAEDHRGTICGFSAAGYDEWNARAVIWHLYVAPTARRQGVARALLGAIQAYAETLGARRLWLETSSLNVPGVAAYRSLGFSLTGLDMTLYDNTPAEGEAALFFSRIV